MAWEDKCNYTFTYIIFIESRKHYLFFIRYKASLNCFMLVQNCFDNLYILSDRINAIKTMFEKCLRSLKSMTRFFFIKRNLVSRCLHTTFSIPFYYNRKTLDKMYRCCKICVI